MNEHDPEIIWKHGFQCGKKALRQSKEFSQLKSRIAELEAELDALAKFVVINKYGYKERCGSCKNIQKFSDENCSGCVDAGGISDKFELHPAIALARKVLEKCK